MTTIHDQFDDAVRDVDVDLHDLAAASRREGQARQRLRVSLTSLGVAASVATVAGVAAFSGLLAPGGSDEPSEVLSATAPETIEPAAPEGAIEPDPAARTTVRLTGAVGTAILVDQVEELVGPEVTSSDLRAQGGDVTANGSSSSSAANFRDTYSEAVFATDARRTTLGVNVQHIPGYTHQCATPEEQPTCDITTLDDGRVLQTYTERGSKAGRTAVVASVFDPTNETRIAAHASTRSSDTALFDADQLTDIVISEHWGFDVDASWAEAARTLDVALID